MELKDLEEVLNGALRKLHSETEAALQDALTAVESFFNYIVDERLRVKRGRRQELFDLMYNVRSVARALKASKVRLLLASSEAEKRSILAEVELDIEEVIEYVKLLRRMFEETVYDF
ncbi:MAG: hypothetical protein NZ954_01790 [Thermofilaceae archaeon]|nr:hypothetical protein [Thermofilaceae archaeon]MDW8003403.1 hypothetical protein [Thermofilaceae archaeon]